MSRPTDPVVPAAPEASPPDPALALANALARGELAGLDLRGARLAGAKLGGARAAGADLRGADLRGADLHAADLQGANLSGADLSGADLRGARLTDAGVADLRAVGAQAQGVVADSAVMAALAAAGAVTNEGSLAARLRRALGGRGRRGPGWLGAWQKRARSAGRLRAAALARPGGDLRGRDLRGKDLRGALWSDIQGEGAKLTEARLEYADLRRADLVDSDLEGVRFRGAQMQDTRLDRARAMDADLREADLSGASAVGADLSSADLRGTSLRGADLRDSKLRGARLSDLDLEGVRLDGADLQGADVAGVRWEGTSVRGTALSGVLGLADADRQSLLSRGANPGEEGGVAGVSARWLRAAIGLAALGMGVYLAARFLAPGSVEPAQMAAEAEALREADPLSASKRYEALALAAERPEDQVAHRIEAAGLAQKGGDSAGAERILRDALGAAADDPTLVARVRLRLGELLAEGKRWAELKDTVEPLLTMEGQPSVERARGLVLYEDACAGLGVEAVAETALVAALAPLPEAQADLFQAVAEIRANRGQDAEALVALDRLTGLSLPEAIRNQVLETRARVLDRIGRTEDAMAAWRELLRVAAPDSLPAMSAHLSLADLTRRMGHPEQALGLLAPLMKEGADTRMHGRALLLRGGILEDRGDLAAAMADYRAVIEATGLDADALTEARVALARLLLAEGGADKAAAVLKDLAPEAAAAVMAEARLGEGRRLLDAGQPDRALAVFTAMEAGADPATLRAARSGQAEALVATGQLQQAIRLWQDLLSGSPPPEEQVSMTLLLAQALLDKGERSAASELFQKLASSPDPEARAQGQLGLAAAARAEGEHERALVLLRTVVDAAADPAWKVRALQAQAEIAAEDGDTDGAIEAWRGVLGAVSPGGAAALQARLAIVTALEDAGRRPAARTACTAAVSGSAGASRAEARLACAELDLRLGEHAAARAAFATLLGDDTAPEEIRVQAALGEARLALAPGEGGNADPAAAASTLQRALQTATAPGSRVPLLALLAQALEARGDAAGARAAGVELDALAAKAPEDAARTYADDATRARARGDRAAAIDLLTRALALPLSPALRAELGVDLGGDLLDAGDLDGAASRLEAARKDAADGTISAFLADLGRAEVERRRGDPKSAVTRLRALVPPDTASRQRWLEALATALGQANDPEAARTWKALAEEGADAGLSRAVALKGEADAALAHGDAAGALALYEQAEGAAGETSDQGWAALGATDALARLQRDAEARTRLDTLRAHPDPEVRFQAALRISAGILAAGDPTGALAALDGLDGRGLGPAWDTALTEARVKALVKSGRSSEAKAAWEGLASRWPGEEEAELPAWLGLAYLADQAKDKATARTWATKARDNAKDLGYKALAQELLAGLGPAEKPK